MITGDWAELDALRAENARLRELLAEHGIESGLPEEPEPEHYGPPTLLEHITTEAFKRSAEKFMRDITRWEADMRWLMGSTWPATVRIKLPSDFTVQG